MARNRIDAIRALTVLDELKELEAVFGKTTPAKAISARNRAYPKGIVKLKRTFSMMGVRFWRVTAPHGHPNLGSDLSVQGLTDWGII